TLSRNRSSAVCVFSVLTMSTTQKLLIVSVITVLSLLPFSNKAFYADDPLFVWTGKHIQTEPMNPYNCKVNWYGTDMMMSDVTKNPPIACYYIAGAAAIMGWNETGLHIAFLLPALLVVSVPFYLQSTSARAAWQQHW